MKKQCLCVLFLFFVLSAEFASVPLNASIQKMCVDWCHPSRGFQKCIIHSLHTFCQKEDRSADRQIGRQLHQIRPAEAKKDKNKGGKRDDAMDEQNTSEMIEKKLLNGQKQMRGDEKEHLNEVEGKEN